MSKTINDASHELDSDPSHLAQPGLLTRCKDYVVAQLLRAGWPLLMATAKRWAPDRPPDKVFSYPERPWLKLRVWFPPSLDPTTKKPTRTLFEVHGGGWLFGAPTDVDYFSSYFSDHQDCVVVSLDYRKTWKNPFPTGLEDLEWTIARIFDDDSLCVDRHNAAAKGESAGGNLVLGLAQNKYLKLKGVISCYPVTKMIASRPTPLNPSRPRSAPWPPGKQPKSDPLAPIIDMLQYYYIPEDHDIRDPRMSPFYATRRMLSQPVYLIGAEDDFLCDEARAMAAKLTGMTIVQAKEKEAPVGFVDKGSLPDVVGWQHQGVRWEQILRSGHGFDMGPFGKGEERKARISREFLDRVGAWLEQEVWV